jgi:hypothetical protein
VVSSCPRLRRLLKFMLWRAGFTMFNPDSHSV